MCVDVPFWRHWSHPPGPAQQGGGVLITQIGVCGRDRAAPSNRGHRRIATVPDTVPTTVPDTIPATVAAPRTTTAYRHPSPNPTLTSRTCPLPPSLC